MILLLSDDENDVNIAKLYAEHGSITAAMLAASYRYFKDNKIIDTLAEGFACYRDVANHAKKEHKEERDILYYASHKAPHWLCLVLEGYNSSFFEKNFPDRQKKWYYKFKTKDPNQLFTLGNFLIFSAISSPSEEEENAIVLAKAACTKIFEEVQQVMKTKKAG